MKKSTKKVINYLRRYIGCEIIRTKETAVFGDGGRYMMIPIVLKGFTSDGRILYCHTGLDKERYGTDVDTMPLEFTDRNWITYKKALRAKGNALNKWRGKTIRRIRPTISGDRNFMRGLPPTLVSASKHHAVVMFGEIGSHDKRCVLDYEFTKLEDWELA